MKLSENFTLLELVKSDAALRLGLDNTPSQGVINNLRELAINVLQPIREHYGTPVKVSSGFRSNAVNAAVGGAKTSDHCQGFAVDIEVPGTSNFDLATWILSNLKFTQVILEFYTMGQPNSGWVHVSYDPKSLRNQALTAMKKEGKTIYLTGLVA